MYLPVNVLNELEKVTEYWSPRVIGEVNQQYIKVAKLKGELVWHDHANEDELFYIIKGSLKIEFDDGEVTLNQGEFYSVPKTVRHNPVAENECWIILIESKGTKHTGDVKVEGTKSIEEQLGDN